MSVTHVIRYNGSSKLEVSSSQLAEKVVRRAPALMDGKDDFAISLSRLPEGKRLWDDLSGSWPRFFLQAAGSAEGMMVEVRKENPDGSDSLYKVARPLPEERLHTEAIDVTWNGRVESAPADEVFDATEAGDIFWYYYQHGAVPEKYELRVLE
ncbi:hypothetical protein HQQ80_21040 [Microbacteriaceae bacterium VKM Ac-2855]|nr:hypothetical protein [Microbacteriaceae bacterium VKM Ac-2855]